MLGRTGSRVEGTCFVIDANVVVKWFVNEEGSEEAERLLREALYGRMELHSPCLLLFEAASALRKYAVNAYISGEHARKSVEKLLETPLESGTPKSFPGQKR